MAQIGDELHVLLELVPIAALANELLVVEGLGDDHMRHRCDDCNVRARLQWQVELRLDVRRAYERDLARVENDQLGTSAQALLHPRTKDRMGLRRVGTNQHDHVGVLDRVKVLGTGRRAIGLAEAVARRGVADAGAGIDVVVAKALADQLLDEVGLLVRAAARRDAADRVDAVRLLDRGEAVRNEGVRVVPRDLAPRLIDRIADHRLGDAIGMAGIAIGKAALDAGVATVGLAILKRHHADQLVAAHLGLEGTADAAVGARCDDGMLGDTDLDDRLLHQRRGRAGLDTGAARDTVRIDKRLVRTGRDAALEAATLDRQGKRALHLFAGADATRAGDALRRVVGEVRIRLVLLHVAEVRLATHLWGEVVGVDVVANAAETDDAGLRLQLTVTVGGARQAIERMVGDVQLHHATTNLL